jgi:hypothetical protein
MIGTLLFEYRWLMTAQNRSLEVSKRKALPERKARLAPSLIALKAPFALKASPFASAMPADCLAIL